VRLLPVTGLGVQTLLFSGLVWLLGIAFDVRAPWLGFHRAGGLPDHVELTVSLDLADEYRLVQVVVFLVHLGDDARGCLEGLAGQGLGTWRLDFQKASLESLRVGPSYQFCY
jgi:hypothetical protein